MYEQIVYIGIYNASEDATTLAFLNRLEDLDAFAEKHLDLVVGVKTGGSRVGGPELCV